MTPRMLQAYEFVITYQKAHGVPPTHREIAAGLGLKSCGNAHRYIDDLVRRGYLSRLPGDRKARNLIVRERQDAP